MNKITKWHILTIGLLLITMAGAFLWWGLCYVNTNIEKMLCLVAAILLVFISSIFFILFALSFGKSQNVFLYDKKTKRNISVEDLTYERVCEFLDSYIGIILQGKKNLLFSDIFNNSLLKNVPEIYHPLIQMRLLLLWMEIDSSDQWMLFVNSDKSYINIMEDTLYQFGEYQISSRLQYLWSSYSGDDTEIRNFFSKNTDYLKEFILNYVKVNIHLF
jgi:hypothetical protein